MKSRTNCLLKDKHEQEEFVGVDFEMVESTVLEPEDNPPIKSKRGRKKVDTPVITQGSPNI